MKDDKPKTKGIIIGIIVFIVIIAIAASSGDKSETETDDNASQATTVEQNDKKELVKRMNKWFIEDYLKRPDNQVMVDGQYVEPNHKLSIVKGFRADGDSLIAIYYDENLRAEGWEQKDLIGVIKAALYAYVDGTGEALHFDNFDSGFDAESLKIANKFEWFYTEAYLKDRNDIDV